MNLHYQQEPPTVDEYLALREAVKFSPRSRQAAETGLPGSSWAITAREGGKAVGMARLVGDGGCSFLVVDVIVHPEYQGRGIGTEMMRQMDEWIDSNLPDGAMISLLADEPGRRLYERLGYRFTAPESLAMKRFIARAEPEST